MDWEDKDVCFNCLYWLIKEEIPLPATHVPEGVKGSCDEDATTMSDNTCEDFVNNKGV